ncbi:Ubiquinone/menaquinone biosynthesis C-methylase UbiE [Candidatus Methanomarinus sp.]|nr:Ubiquinone/menaquinone biosynthesis C-methylase UbiE [ANME-2 cluster archaeon]
MMNSVKECEYSTSEYSKRILKGTLGYPHRKRFEDLLKICAEYKNMRVLDIGCHDFFFEKEIINYQKMLVGCDLDWESGLYCANDNIKKYMWDNVYVIASMGECLPLKDDSFDLILCFETLEHADDEYKMLKEIDRVSAKNATLIISAPTEFGIILLFKQVFRYIAHHDYYFDIKQNRYSFKELLHAGVFCNLERVSRIKYCHKGYDYRNTVEMLSSRFELIQKINTPFEWMLDRLSYGTILIFQKID